MHPATLTLLAFGGLLLLLAMGLAHRGSTGHQGAGRHAGGSDPAIGDVRAVRRLCRGAIAALLMAGILPGLLTAAICTAMIGMRCSLNTALAPPIRKGAPERGAGVPRPGSGR
jgi:hypothetical protein